MRSLQFFVVSDLDPDCCSRYGRIAGGAARLVAPLAVEAWTEAIDSVLSDLELRRPMSEAGIKRAAHFSWTTEAVRSLLEAV